MQESQLVRFEAKGLAVTLESEKRCCTKPHAQRVLDREAHHHKQLWTKDSHGGPYRKVCPE